MFDSLPFIKKQRIKAYIKWRGIIKRHMKTDRKEFHVNDSLAITALEELVREVASDKPNTIGDQI